VLSLPPPVSVFAALRHHISVVAASSLRPFSLQLITMSSLFPNIKFMKSHIDHKQKNSNAVNMSYKS
jgi:hypothetical protein